MTKNQPKEIFNTLIKKAAEIKEIVSIPIEGKQRGEDFWKSLADFKMQGHKYLIQQKAQLLELPQIKPHIKTAEAAYRAWLNCVIEQANLENAETVVKKFQHKYLQEKPFNIARYLIQEKSIHVASSGLLIAAIPGKIAEALKIDAVMVTLLQAELIYEIAATYGFSLKETARKNEVLAIFEQVLDAGQALRAGLGALQAVPFAGTFIGAGTDIGTLVTLGNTACKFYDGKVNPYLSQEQALAASKEESERSLKTTITQEGIMAQISVHMILADSTENSWETVVPKLKDLDFSLASLDKDIITASVKSSQPLESLLDQLDEKFAAQVLTNCLKIAKLDGHITPEENKVIETITQKFSIDLNLLKEVFTSNVSKF